MKKIIVAMAAILLMMIEMRYLSDDEILRNQGSEPLFSDGSKEGQKQYKKAVRRRR